MLQEGGPVSFPKRTTVGAKETSQMHPQRELSFSALLLQYKVKLYYTPGGIIYLSEPENHS